MISPPGCPSLLATSPGSGARRQSPLDASPPQLRGVVLFAGAGASAIHAALVAGSLALAPMPRAGSAKPAPVAITQMVEVQPALPVPPSPPPAPSEATTRPDRAPAAARVTRPRRQAPAASAAIAEGPETPPAELLDFSDSLIDAPGESSFAASSRPAGVANGSGRALASGAAAPVAERASETDGVDRSKAPALHDGAPWDCPFPDEADAAGLHAAVVTLSVSVAADGHVESVAVVNDPGNGFGHAAQRCALGKHWQAGLDRSGQAVAMTAVVNVRFLR